MAVIEDGDRLPPYNLEAEQAVLGSILLEPTCMNLVSWLKTNDFYRDKNQWVYEALIEIGRRGVAVNLVTLQAELDRVHRLEPMGGVNYLQYLMLETPTSVHVEHYAEIVHSMSKHRAMIVMADDIAEIGYEKGNAEESYGKVLEKVLRFGEAGRLKGLQIIGETMRMNNEFFSGWIDDGRQPWGLRTGFQRFDNHIGGLKPSTVTLIAGRPGMGKTGFMIECACNQAKIDEAVAIFSLEMSIWELTMRMISSAARIDTSKPIAKDAEDKEEQAEKLDQAYSEVMNLPILIDDSSGLTLEMMQARALQAKTKMNIKGLYIDYLSLIKAPGKTPYERTTNISQGLKAMAKALELPVIVMTQLSRFARDRKVFRPMLEDLRDSGTLEQDADNVIGLYRPIYYYPMGHNKYIDNTEYYMEVSVLKFRMGKANPRGVDLVPMYYEPQTGFMKDWWGEKPKKND